MEFVGGVEPRRPMVVMPQWSDQPTNAKFGKRERETCVREVMRGKRSGEINWNALKLMERGCEDIC
ncbi:unnamed protein product [Malus baccata var. baccata]